MPYRGTLSISQATTINLTNGAGNPGAAGATILFVVSSSGKKNLDRFETLTAAAGTGAQLQPAFTAGTVRMVVEVVVPNGGGGCVLQVTQANGANMQDQVTADTSFVYDVVS